ncbi:hypothetical protein PV327_005578 [Microctonus hyperodae]|uniref:Uncharacterized protein n=2 Tax=Braconidae TaxID=7402 RepID=A0AA39G1M5_MICHY|nr:hypothetical protein PV327_005578 [Microctonus hyperodae]
MLKWTVSRSMSTASSTPHDPPTLGGKTTRRPFRDLSNTPPTAATQSRVVSQSIADTDHRPIPARRRRCRSHGNDLRTYFQVTKPNTRSGKRQSIVNSTPESPKAESFYQSTPRVDADIGPLTYVPQILSRCPTAALTLPTDPSSLPRPYPKTFHHANSNELPQNIMNDARVNLQSHVSDFFQQISVAGSPEDVMEADSVPLDKSKLFFRNSNKSRATTTNDSRISSRSRLAKVTKLHARCKTPYHTKAPQARSPFKIRETPLAGKLSHLSIDHDALKFENMNNTVTEIITEQQENNISGKTVAEILMHDANERRRILEINTDDKIKLPIDINSQQMNVCESIMQEQILTVEDEEGKAKHNDSSVSSASQLLENPSPISWAFCSPSNDSDGEFTLRRQRGIRRKRQQRDQGNNKNSASKRAKKRSQSVSPTTKRKIMDGQVPPVQAVNLYVKKLPLETDLDSPMSEIATSKTLSHNQKNDETSKTNLWELESPKSSLMDDFPSCKSSFLQSMIVTPEAPLIATVRRCLKYSPEVEIPRANSKGSIEIEYDVIGDNIHVRVIRCKDLRRTYEGPIHAYVKASLKNQFGEGVVKRTAVHRATPNPVFHETLILPCPNNNNSTNRATSLDIAVWHRDRRARRSELLGCMTLPLPLAQDKEATWHPLEVATSRNTSTPYPGLPQDCAVSPPLSKDSDHVDNNNSNTDDLTYLRHLELEQVDPLTGQPLHPGFAAKGGRTPCTITRRLIRHSSVNQVAWGFSLSWGRPPRVERVDSGSPADRAGLRPGDHVVFVDTTNVVTRAREDILSLIQAATNQLILEVYRKSGGGSGHINNTQRPSLVTIQSALDHHNGQQAIAFTTEVEKSPQIFPNIAPDAPPDEELNVRETRYWTALKSGVTRFCIALAERRDVLSITDHSILFQNLEELLKLSEEIRDEGGGIESYLIRVPRIIASYRRYLSGLQRSCCLLVSLRRNSAFAKLVCEPAVPHKRRPDITGLLLLPLEHYREMTRLLGLASPRNCQKSRDLLQGYREATANAGLMEPPRDTGRPLLSLQEVESRLVFARCRPFTLAVPGRQWLFGGALAKVEGRRLQPSWALLLTDLLVFARVSRDRVLFVTEDPLRLSNIAEACFTVRKRPTEFRLQVAITPNGSFQNEHMDVVYSGGCSPHSRPRRRVLILRAPNPELKAIWHNLLQRQIIYVNTGCEDTPSSHSPDASPYISSNFITACDSSISPQIAILRNSHEPIEEQLHGESLESILKVNNNTSQENNHLAQWVQNSHQIPPPDHELTFTEEWTAEELAARAPRESSSNIQAHEQSVEEQSAAPSSDPEQHSTTSSASLSTVKSNSVNPRKNGTLFNNTPVGAINICRRCHRSGCPTPPPTSRDPFSPLPPKISILPPTPDLCINHRLKNGAHDSPSKNSSNCTPADGNTEDGSEDDLECDGEPPYRALRRFGTMSSLDQDDELDEQADDETRDQESPPSGLRSWTARASNFVVSKMVLLEQLGEGVGGYLLQPPVPPERTEFSLDPNDEEGTTSGGTSGDDIWGTPTSGGPDDESFTASPPSTNGNVNGEDNYGLSLNADDDQDESGDSDDRGLPEINMEQLLTTNNLSSLRCFLGRRRLEPLLEEEDSPGSGKLQLTREDEEFRKKILDLHTKLSNVDQDPVKIVSPQKKPEKRVTLVDTPLPPLSSRSEGTSRILKPALKSSLGTSSSDEAESSLRMLEKRRLRKIDLEHERRQHLEQLRIRSERIDEACEVHQDEHMSITPQETTFLNRLRIRRRSIKLLKFLSGKSSDRSHEERATRLLKMYMPEKSTKRQNTISIHHTSRDRRFWKLRNRRRSNSS